MKKIIFDTDIGGDCDDVMALDLLMAAHKAGECMLLGVTYSSRVEQAPKAIQVITGYHGISVPVGTCPTQEGATDHYSQPFIDTFPQFVGGEIEDSVRLMRRLLAGEDKVTIVATGSLYNLAELLKSPPDEYSLLDGMSLVKEKVEEFAVMAGNFSHQSCFYPKNGAILPDGSLKRIPECNILIFPDSSREFFSMCPIKTVISPYELGFQMLTGAPMCAAGKDKTPDSMAYVIRNSENGRHSWDPVTAYYALYGASPWMYRTVSGRIIVDEKGFTDFLPGDGNFSLLYPAVAKETLAKEIDAKAMRLFL